MRWTAHNRRSPNPNGRPRKLSAEDIRMIKQWHAMGRNNRPPAKVIAHRCNVRREAIHYWKYREPARG